MWSVDLSPPPSHSTCTHFFLTVMVLLARVVRVVSPSGMSAAKSLPGTTACVGRAIMDESEKHDHQKCIILNVTNIFHREIAVPHSLMHRKSDQSRKHA